MYRLGTEFVVRLPRFPDAARRLGVAFDWLLRLTDLPAAAPEVVDAGTHDELYPFRWAVLRWLDGIDAWEAREQDGWFGATSDTILPRLSGGCGAPRWWTRLPVNRVSGGSDPITR